jgi:AcrR family transcriptional regulator
LAPTTIPRQRRKEERPQELLEAALSLFVEKGFAATKTDEVAQRAGVSKGTLYLYYPSKEELLKAVISHYLSSQIREGFEEAAAHQGKHELATPDLLLDLLSRWWIRVLQSPASAVMKLVVTEVRNFPEIAVFYAQEVIEPGHQLISSLIERGIARGEFHDVDVPMVVHSLVLPMVMLCVHQHSLGACPLGDKAIDAPEFIQQHIALVLRGLARPAPAGLRSKQILEGLT